MMSLQAGMGDRCPRASFDRRELNIKAFITCEDTDIRKMGVENDVLFILEALRLKSRKTKSHRTTDCDYLNRVTP